MKNTYFQDELRYLREVGPEFQKAHPEIARFLGDRGSDPDVERLLEGVAFLCGRIREKLDDELPELTASLMSLLWPHYLRPIPSMAILEFLPDLQGMQGPISAKAGSEVASIPVDGTRCRFQTAWDVQIKPWNIEEVHLTSLAGGPLELTLVFQTGSQAVLPDLELDRVRIHFAGDPRTAFTLYWLLCCHTESITVGTEFSAGMTASGKTVSLSSHSVEPAGLLRSEGVIPYPVRSFSGYRLIQEYFALKERFLFVDVLGLGDAVCQLEAESRLVVTFTFNRRLDKPPQVKRENVRLHCVPIINRFTHNTDPVRTKFERTEHLLRPARRGLADARHAEIFSVDKISGLVRADVTRKKLYKPFFAFGRKSVLAGNDSAYYTTRVVPNVANSNPRLGTDTYLCLVPGSPSDGIPHEETISVEVTCTNRNLPGALRADDIHQPMETSPPGVPFRNLAKPTEAVAPPIGKALHWRLIAHMALNYASLISLDTFRDLLRVYDFQSEYDAQRATALEHMLKGVESFNVEFDNEVMRGAVARGVHARLVLNEEHFAGIGDAFVFASVVERFLALYATLNAFSKVTVKMSKSGEVYEFPARWGEQPTPAWFR